jgi:hypothetical protein
VRFWSIEPCICGDQFANDTIKLLFKQFLHVMQGPLQGLVLVGLIRTWHGYLRLSSIVVLVQPSVYRLESSSHIRLQSIKLVAYPSVIQFHPRSQTIKLSSQHRFEHTLSGRFESKWPRASRGSNPAVRSAENLSNSLDRSFTIQRTVMSTGIQARSSPGVLEEARGTGEEKEL